jgi:hypothetical protein
VALRWRRRGSDVEDEVAPVMESSPAATQTASAAVFPTFSGSAKMRIRGGGARGFRWWPRRGVIRAEAAVAGGWRWSGGGELRRRITGRPGGVEMR